jgi:hypothetical protein
VSKRERDSVRLDLAAVAVICVMALPGWFCGGELPPCEGPIVAVDFASFAADPWLGYVAIRDDGTALGCADFLSRRDAEDWAQGYAPEGATK